MANILGFATIEIRPDMSPMQKAGAAFAAAGVAAGALIAAGIGQAMGQADIKSSLQAQLGTSNTVAAAQGKIAGKLYSSGVSDSFQGAADAIKAVVQSGLAPPDATNAQLQSIATKATDVAKVFGQDFGDVTNQVSQLVRNGLAKNSDEAFDIITKGFQSGANKAGDFLQVIEEYGTTFRASGVTGQQALGLIDQGLKAGARDADKVADAVKEFGIRAVDGSKLTGEGFKALGLNADDMAAKFGKGGKSANAVLDLTLDRLRGIEDPVRRSQIATQLFGTQAEDLGEALFALDPSAATDRLGKFAGATDKIGKTIRSGPTFEINKFMRGVKQAFIEVLGNQVLPVLAKFAVWMNTNVAPPVTKVAQAFAGILVPALTGIITSIAAVVNWFRQLGIWLVPITILVVGFTAVILASQIATLAVTAAFTLYGVAIRVWSGITRIATGVQLAFSAAMSASPIGLVVVAIAALVAVIIIAYKRSETFRNIIKGVWDALKTGFTAVINAAKTTFNWIKDHWVLLVSILGGPIVAAVIQIVKNWDKIKEGAANAIGAVVDFFKRLPGRIVNAVGDLKRLLLNKGADLLLGLLNGAKNLYTRVNEWVRNRPKEINKAMGSVGRILYQKGRDFFSGLWNGAKALYEAVRRWVRERPSAIRTAMGSVGRILYQKGRDFFSGLWNGAKAIYSAISRWVRGRPSAIKSSLGRVTGTLYAKGKDIVSGLWNGLKEKWKDAIGWVRGLKNRVVSAIKSAFGISSPARVMVPLGVNIMAGLMKGILGSRGVLKSAVKSIFGSVTGVFKKGGSLLGDLVGSLGSSIGLGDSSVRGSAQQYAQLYMKTLGFGSSQWPALKALWQAESGWNPLAHNASSGAHGIPQSLPASKMASEGSDYWTNAATQIRWGLKYIRSRYGSPAAAWSFWQRQSPHWYDSGGLARLAGFIPKMTNAPERVLSPRQTALFERMITGRGPTPASAGTPAALVIERVVIENRGVIGSRQELENWLVTSLDTLRKKGRIK